MSVMKLLVFVVVLLQFFLSCIFAQEELFADDPVPFDALGKVVSRNGSDELRYEGQSIMPSLKVRERLSTATFSSHFWQTANSNLFDLSVKTELLASSYQAHFEKRREEEQSGKVVRFTAIEMVEFAEETAPPPSEGAGLYVSSLKRAAVAHLEFTYRFSSAKNATEFRGSIKGGGVGSSGAVSTYKTAKDLEDKVGFEIRVQTIGGQVIEKARFFDQGGKFSPTLTLKVLDEWQKSITDKLSPRELMVKSFVVSPFGKTGNQTKKREVEAAYKRLYSIYALLSVSDKLNFDDKTYVRLENESQRLRKYILAGGTDRLLRRDPYREYPLDVKIAELELFKLRSTVGTSDAIKLQPECGWGFKFSLSHRGPGWSSGWWRGGVWYYPNITWIGNWSVIERIDLLLGPNTIHVIRSASDFHQVKSKGIARLTHFHRDPNTGDFGDFGGGKTQIQIARELLGKISVPGKLSVVVHFVDGSSSVLQVSK